MNKKGPSSKRLYQKPKLEQVQLVVEEYVLIQTCKTGGAVGPVVQNCRGVEKCSFQQPS